MGRLKIYSGRMSLLLRNPGSAVFRRLPSITAVNWILPASGQLLAFLARRARFVTWLGCFRAPSAVQIDALSATGQATSLQLRAGVQGMGTGMGKGMGKGMEKEKWMEKGMEMKKGMGPCLYLPQNKSLESSDGQPLPSSRRKSL